jgi:hypothetical protein
MTRRSALSRPTAEDAPDSPISSARPPDSRDRRSSGRAFRQRRSRGKPRPSASRRPSCRRTRDGTLSCCGNSDPRLAISAVSVISGASLSATLRSDRPERRGSDGARPSPFRPNRLPLAGLLGLGRLFRLGQLRCGADTQAPVEAQEIRARNTASLAHEINEVTRVTHRCLKAVFTGT